MLNTCRQQSLLWNVKHHAAACAQCTHSLEPISFTKFIFKRAHWNKRMRWSEKTTKVSFPVSLLIFGNIYLQHYISPPTLCSSHFQFFFFIFFFLDFSRCRLQNANTKCLPSLHVRYSCEWPCTRQVLHFVGPNHRDTEPPSTVVFYFYIYRARSLAALNIRLQTKC